MGYKISEFSAISGVTPSNIRFYEQRGFPSSGRSESGYRQYQFEDSYRINTFNAFLAHGFTVSEAVTLLEAHPAKLLAEHLEQKNHEIEEQLVLLRKKLEWNQRVQYLLNHIEEELSQVHVILLPDLCFLKCTDGFDHAPSLENGELMARWVDALPISHYAGRVLSDGSFTLGMVMEFSDAKEMGLEGPITEIIPRGEYYSLLMRGDDVKELKEDPRIQVLQQEKRLDAESSFQVYLMFNTVEYGNDVNVTFFRKK